MNAALTRSSRDCHRRARDPPVLTLPELFYRPWNNSSRRRTALKAAAPGERSRRETLSRVPRCRLGLYALGLRKGTGANLPLIPRFGRCPTRVPARRRSRRSHLYDALA